MANPVIRSKRSSVQGKIPTVAQLSLGELAINTFDGKVFLSQDKSSVGIATTVIAINPWSVGPGTSTYNTYFTSGNVGVGTTIVKTSLDVIGNHYISGSIGIGSTNPMCSLDSTAIQIRQDSGSNQRLILRGQPGSQYRWNIDNFSSSNNFRIFREDDSTTANGVVVVGITSTNNFGLGTLTATSKLHVVGDTRITGGIYDSSNNIGIAGSVLSSTGSGLAWVAQGAGGGTPAGVNGAIQYRNNNSFAGATQLFYDSTTNNTGVGITLPTSILHVVGNTLISGIATATTFSGTTATFTNITANGGLTGNVNATGVSTAAFLRATTVNATGIVTASSFSGSLANTLTLATSGTGLSGSTTFNNSGAATFTVTSNATSANTVSAIVARDASGNFSAGTITAALTGNVTGNVSGSSGSCTGNAATVTTNANLNGDITSSGNTTSIAAGVIVNADINASAAIADTKLATISTAGKVSNSATTATNANTASAIVARDASGNFSAGTITAALTGNVTGNVSGSSGSCTGNAATATTASACSGNSATATTATNLSGGSVVATTGAFNNYLRTLEQVRATGWYGTPTGSSYTGLAVEMGVSSGSGYTLCYNRNTSAYGNFNLAGAATNILLPSSGTTITVTGSISATGSIAGTNITSGGNVTGSSASCTGNAATATTHVVTDSRNTATTPQTINQGVVFDFKANATEGLSDGGTYFGEMTFRQYGSSTDWSGGSSHQLGFTDNGNIWQRTGSSTAWGSWKKLVDSSNYSSYALPLSGGTISGSVVPNANNTINLGSSGARWANVFSNDLDLCNEGGSNSVDGTWGSYLIQEGYEDLFMINRRTGKKYKFLVQEVQ